MKQRARTGRLWRALTALVLLALAAGGCQSGVTSTPEQTHEHSYEMPELSAIALNEGEKLRVVATTNIVGDVIARVGGDRIALTTLMDVGVDPHTYVPTPSDTAAIHDAHVVFASGAGLEEGLEEWLDSASGAAVEIQLSFGLALRQSEKGADEHAHADADPHVWFDVQNVIQWVATVERTLGTLDPVNARVYAANAEAYTDQLEELDVWVAAQVATLPQDRRKFVTNHPAFGYLADRYGLEQVGAVYPLSPSSEPSAQDIAALQDAIRAFGVLAVFTESTVNPKLAEQVARDTGVRLVALYTGSLGGPGSGVESYIELMRYDVNAIVEALR